MAPSGILESADSGKLRLYSCCGGQGPSNLTGLDDLVHLARTYGDRAPIRHLLDISSSSLELLASIPHRSSFFSGHGFPLSSWLDDSVATAPSSDELALSPYSFPINTLLSLVHYALAANTIGVDPSQLRDRLHGVIGHSQGVFAAAAIAHNGKGWPAFYSAASRALKLSFWVGLESHLAAPGSTLSAEDVADCLQHDEGAPSYLLSVTGLSHEHLQRLIRTASNDNVQISLINGYKKFVLAGTPQALRNVCLVIRRVNVPQTLDQTRVPFTQRRPMIDVRFLPVSAPYHSSFLEPVEAAVLDAMKGCRLTGSDIAIPLYCQVNGKIQNLQDQKDVLSALIRAVTIVTVDWPGACHKMDSPTHVLSFGPGAVGTLVQDVVEGTGVHVLNILGRSLSPSLSALKSEASLPLVQNWGQMYLPRLRTSKSKESESYIETKMTRLLGLPHVMVAGMTPTTCSPEFVAVIMQAGYHAEFACGGYHRPESMEAALRQLAATIPVHRSITCNVIYASPKSLSWQINLLRDLIQEGLPIDSLTIGAGIPSPDVVREWIELLDLSHIWFKPGSVDAIDRVLAIAHQHPSVPIGLQWTGGRAGGHHSFEDFHQGILDRYSHIRNCENVILVAGSGFGGEQDTWPYLTGSWSQKLGFTAMPFDGILLGSRMMVAREAKTSLAAKKLIVQAPGIREDEDWTRCQNEAIGGVISVVSEMGQPIHVLATRGMQLWHEFDRRFFSIRDPGQLRMALKQHREEIIRRLNADYARPWFAVADDSTPVEMEDLTYRQVLHRLCRLMFVERHSRWIDPSYLELVHGFLSLVQARFGTEMNRSDNPVELKEAFDAKYGTQADQVLYPDDVALLLALFRRQGLKPVPFIPILDEAFETWFKKDSLWQSEDVEAVLDQDAQRVCIIQGPVAVQHSTVCDEPVKAILDRICDSNIDSLINDACPRNEDDMFSGIAQATAVDLPGIHVSNDASIYRYQLLGPAIPSSDALSKQLTTGCPWGHAALVSKHVLFGRHRVKNPLRDAFQPGIGDVIEIKHANGTPNEITLYHSAAQKTDSHQIRAALEITLVDAETVSVALVTRSVRTVTGSRPALEFTMKLLGGCMSQPTLQIDEETYLGRVRDLYTELWIGSASGSSSAGLNSEFSDGPVNIIADHVQEFLDMVCQSGPARSRAWRAKGPVVPLDYAVVLAWTALTRPVLLPALDGDPLQLLHQSISLRLARGVRPLSVGDVVMTASCITERKITASGQRVEVSAEILRDAQPVVYLRATFAIQRRTQSASQQFRSIEEPDMVMHITTPVQLEVLISRKWLFLDVASHEILGRSLLFVLNTQIMTGAKDASNSLKVSGIVRLLPDQASTMTSTGAKVGRVYLEEEDHKFNPVMDFLHRHGSPLVQRQPLQSPGWIGDAAIPFTAPPQSSAYAAVSKDTNPIHICPLFARFAGRGQPVLHGMHLSAVVRRILEWMVGDTERRRFQGWSVSFDGIVRAHDQLRMEVQHGAMEDGLMVVHVKVFNANTGDLVMHAEAILEQAPTAYLFTGQGTQEKGMGMTLYGTHKAAQAVWDRAERHFESQYGEFAVHLLDNMILANVSKVFPCSTWSVIIQSPSSSISVANAASKSEPTTSPWHLPQSLIN